LPQQVAADLTIEIVSGCIRPGTRRDENSVARRFRVSRTPVRDALRWLAASGLVQFAPRRGCSVMPVERAKVQDAHEAFGEIEALCARLCALCAGLTEREQLSIMNQSGAPCE
jgi:DNA-binding GntR family transcriptional regulator